MITVKYTAHSQFPFCLRTNGIHSAYTEAGARELHRKLGEALEALDVSRFGGFDAWWKSQIPGFRGMGDRPFGYDFARFTWEAARTHASFDPWMCTHGWAALPSGCPRGDSLAFATVVWNASRNAESKEKQA